MANELTDLDLGEWSICIDPANEDCSIEFVKSKAGLHVPVLKETDMSDQNDDHTIDNEEGDAELEAFADDVLEQFSELSPEDQAEALVGMALDNIELEGAVEDATEVVKSLVQNAVPKATHEAVLKTLRQAGDIIEKMKVAGHVSAEEGGLVAEIRKANGGADLSPEAVARIERIEKAQAEADRKEAIAKAKTYGFGKAEDVADLSTRIRKALGDKDADLYEAQIKQAGALQKASPLFKSVGEDAGNPDSGDPEAILKAKVTEIRKADSKLTEAQAMDRALEENPELYTQYMDNRRRA